MKNPSIIREICGSEPGYRKHRRMDEEICQECRSAHNVHRREFHSKNPSKNAEYVKRYKTNHPERVKDSYRKKNPLEAKEARRQKRAEETRLRREALQKAKRTARQAVLEQQMAATAERKLERKRLRAIESAKREALRKQEKAQRDVEREKAKEEEILRRKLISLKLKVDKEIILVQRRILRSQEQEILNSRHGIDLTDYYRCQRNNVIACEACKASAAKYAREYRKANRHIARTWKRSNRTNKNRLKPGAKQIYYSRESILERDDYTCYLCGDKVDLNAAHNMKEEGWEMYPHLDHVIPLSKGGDDTPDNVRTTHAKCNMAKLDTPVNSL
jgi:5-methylcytosine-specific restriction endonuclease McrA